ncbi:ABC transporter substrate-binding protein [Antarctobacter heliothermus]|nr:ABC transporter substrate-binding protein [Antarctobacter heliothermus]
MTFAFMIAVSGALGATAASAEDAVASVVRIYTTTVQTGQSPKRLADRLAPSIDLQTLSSKILGKAYASATPQDRSDFNAVLLEVIAFELSRRLGNEQTFTVLRSRTLSGGDVVVLTKVTKSDGSEKSIDWKMRPCGSVYCIYDLRSDNVSFSVARRDEFSARLQSAGGSLAGLTTSLRAEIAARQ